jgi:hypothetical protein
MSAKSVFKMGFLSMIAATGLFVASNGFAADAHQRVDVIGSIGSEGPVYPYTKPMSH